jgi:hypothetical protein
VAISRDNAGARARFVAWNFLGIFDLVLAVTMGILNSPSAFGILAGSGPTTLLMSQFPRSLIPTFFVPLYIVLHLLALVRRREISDRKFSTIRQGLVAS